MMLEWVALVAVIVALLGLSTGLALGTVRKTHQLRHQRCLANIRQLEAELFPPLERRITIAVASDQAAKRRPAPGKYPLPTWDPDYKRPAKR